MNTISDLEKPINEYNFPRGILKLNYTKHAKSRLIERTTGSLILAPNYIRLTSDNTINIIAKGKRILHATVFLEYKKNVNMYLAITVPEGVVKTVYFKDVKKRYKTTGYKEWAEQKEEIHVTDILVPIPRTEYTTPEKSFSYKEKEKSGGIISDVGNVSRNLGGEESGWEKLFGVIRRILRA